MDNHIDHDRKNGPIATAAYALFDVGNSAVGAMHATFILQCILPLQLPLKTVLLIGDI